MVEEGEDGGNIGKVEEGKKMENREKKKDEGDWKGVERERNREARREERRSKGKRICEERQGRRGSVPRLLDSPAPALYVDKPSHTKI